MLVTFLKGEEHRCMQTIVTIYLVQTAQTVCSSAAFIHEESTKFQSQPGKGENEPRVINLHLASQKVWIAFFEPWLEAVSGRDCGGMPDLNHVSSGNNTCC